MVAKGELKVKVYKRALGLLELDHGKMLSAVAETLKKLRRQFQAHAEFRTVVLREAYEDDF